MLKRLLSTVRALRRRGAFEDEMADEMRFHIEHRAAELIRRGMAPHDAARQARLEFGSIERHKDLARESVGLRLIDECRADVRLAVRRLAARPARAVFVVVTIALGIGAATAVFSVVDQTVLRPPPYLDADRLVDALDTNRKTGGGGNNLTPAKILGWQSQPALFERFEGYAPQQFDVSGNGVPDRILGWEISPGLFSMLGVSPQLGRAFANGEGRPGSARVAIISDALWRRRFGGEADVLGRRLRLNGQEYTIIGVMPGRFRLYSALDDVWVPFDLRSHAGDPQASAFYGIGRLARGVRMADAQTLANQMADRLQRESPLPRSWDLMLLPKHVADVRGAARTAMFVLLGAVGFVLLITCANVSSVLLTDVPGRMREMAVRSALGGSRARLIRSLLVETSVLAAVGGTLGIVLARWAVREIVGAMPHHMVSWITTTIEVDARVLWVAAGLIVLTAIAVGLVPALRGSSAKPDAVLKTGGGRAATGRLPGALVVVEIAFSVLLLAGAALMTRTLVNLESIDPGFDPDGLVAMNVDLPSDRYPTVAARAAFFEEVQRRIARVAGVTGSTITQGVPPWLGGFSWGELQEEGRGTIGSDVTVTWDSVTLEYFDVTKTPIVTGRAFHEHEPGDSVVVSEALARLIAPDGGAVGHRIRIDAKTWSTIVGVARTAEVRIGDRRIPLQMYRPWPPSDAGVSAAPPQPGRRTYDYRMLVVRARHPLAAVPAIEHQIWSVDSAQPIENVTLVSDAYAEAFARQRFVLMLMSAFSVIALILTAAGIFGLLAQMVAQRRREIGIRMALGARPAQVLRLIASRGLALTLAGAVIGVGVALMLAPVLQSQLFEITPTDPVSYASVVALLGIVAFVACWLPARTATRVDPATALRVE
ncbi:MAG TPA: ABC transporter permease [Vicinamibacterales bacterium]|nr:ABC transporter permease [Vicinamibacterales bacterium]